MAYRDVAFGHSSPYYKQSYKLKIKFVCYRIMNDEMVWKRNNTLSTFLADRYLYIIKIEIKSIIYQYKKYKEKKNTY